MKTLKEKVLCLLGNYPDNTQAFNTMKIQMIITFNQALHLLPVKPPVTIDIKRYAQAIINTSEDREKGTCTHCLVDTYYYPHKLDCIVQDAKSILKEKQ